MRRSSGLGRGLIQNRLSGRVKPYKNIENACRGWKPVHFFARTGRFRPDINIQAAVLVNDQAAMSAKAANSIALNRVINKTLLFIRHADEPEPFYQRKLSFREINLAP